MKKYLFSVLCILLLVSCGGGDTEDDVFGSVYGVVSNSDTGVPVEGVKVQILGTSITTDIDGSFSFENVKVGERVIVAASDGYRDYESQMEVLEGESVTMDIPLFSYNKNAIDFEILPQESAADGLVVADQYKTSYGITFSLENGASPVLAKVGGDAASAFVSDYGNDEADPLENIGKYFLTDDGEVSDAPMSSLVVAYDTPTRAASGVVLDIDLGEFFTITAVDVNGNTIKKITVNAGDDDTGDGIATDWFIESDARNISKLFFFGRRKANNLFGLGFDNFFPRSLPKEDVFGSVEGNVSDFETGEPIEGATIEVQGVSASTDANGVFLVENVVVGDKVLVASRVGYQNYESRVSVKENSTTNLDVSIFAFSKNVINFETIPGGVPAEGVALAEQYKALYGISFSLKDGSNPVLAMIGGEEPTAFVSDFGNDNVDPNEDVGNYFLTDDGLIADTPPPALIVTYDTPTTASSGVILDLDLKESFTITAYDLNGNTITETIISSGDEGTGDGVAKEWSIGSDTRDIYKISFSGNRQGNGLIGYGFDNFSPRSVQ